MKFFALLACLCMLGCGAPGMSEIVIDPRLDPAEQEAAITAAQEWFAAVPEATLPIRIGENRGTGYVTRGDCDGKATWGATRQSTERHGTVIYFCPLFPLERVQADPDLARRVITHELGHALTGTDIHLSAGNIMATISVAGPGVSAVDAEFLREHFSEPTK